MDELITFEVAEYLTTLLFDQIKQDIKFKLNRRQLVLIFNEFDILKIGFIEGKNSKMFLTEVLEAYRVQLQRMMKIGDNEIKSVK